MHPNFKARLVFRPEWLRQTRFGEILYRGDLLLKELSEGVPVLDARDLRAGAIRSYVSASARHLARGLRSAFENGLSEDAPPNGTPIACGSILVSSASGSLHPGPRQRRARKSLRESHKSLLNWRGSCRTVASSLSLFRPPPLNEPLQRTAIPSMCLAFTPKCFPSHKGWKDIIWLRYNLDGLSDDLNRNIEQYVAHYGELQILSELFRSYVVAVQISKPERRFVRPPGCASSSRCGKGVPASARISSVRIIHFDGHVRVFRSKRAQTPLGHR